MSTLQKLTAELFDHRDDFDVDSWRALVRVVEAADDFVLLYDDQKASPAVWVEIWKRACALRTALEDLDVALS